MTTRKLLLSVIIFFLFLSLTNMKEIFFNYAQYQTQKIFSKLNNLVKRKLNNIFTI